MTRPRMMAAAALILAAIGSTVALWPVPANQIVQALVVECQGDNDSPTGHGPCKCWRVLASGASSGVDAGADPESSIAYAACYARRMGFCMATDAGEDTCKRRAARHCEGMDLLSTAAIVEVSDPFNATWDAGQFAFTNTTDCRIGRGRCACRPLVDPDAGVPCEWKQPNVNDGGWTPAPRMVTLGEGSYRRTDCVKKQCGERGEIVLRLGEGYSMPCECGGPCWDGGVP